MLSLIWISLVAALYPITGGLVCLLLLVALLAATAILKPEILRTSVPTDRGLVAVIGCGASGLVAMKELRRAGFRVQCFDANAKLGGAFATAYSGLRFTSSTLISQFSDYYDDAEPRFWDQEEYLEYLAGYVEANSLAEFIHLGHRVISCTCAPLCTQSQLELQSETRGHTLTIARGSQTFTRHFDRVVWATGVNHEPNEPRFPGQQEFRGQVVHSSILAGVEHLRGKRVLVVGGGETATDLCLMLAAQEEGETSRVAACVPGLRRSGYFVPRFTRDGAVADVNTSWALHGAPAAWRDEFFGSRLPASQSRSRSPEKRLLGQWNRGKQ